MVTHPVSGKNWPALASEAHVIIVRSPIPRSLPSQTCKLLGLVRYGAGVDMIPVAEASKHGIAVTNAPNANANSVAEYAIGQMLNLARKLPEANQMLRSAGWPAARALAPHGVDLRGKTVAVIGMGNIGSLIAHKCHAGFDMTVLAVRRSPPSGRNAFSHTTLDDALARADVVILSCSLSEETRGLIDSRRLSLMKPAAWLINVSRGPIVDENALAEALRAGRLGGAALDVFAEEPLPGDSALRALPNVILSPHMAGITRESLDRIGEQATKQTIDLLTGKIPEHLVNPEARPSIQERLDRYLAGA